MASEEIETIEKREIIKKTRQFAYELRCHSLKMVTQAKASHVGGCLSIADLLAHLFTYVLHLDADADASANSDHFILSKGHAAAIYYATLSKSGYFPEEWLDHYGENGSHLGGHATHHIPGVDVSTGSLGHGLSLGLGMAYEEQQDAKTVVLMSDGECNEGSVWEAAMLASKLSSKINLWAIIDYNQLQGLGRVDDVMPLRSLKKKWESFGWQVFEVSGHDHLELYNLFSYLLQRQRQLKLTGPIAIIAKTIKGKGVSFMEDRLEWHYLSPTTEQLHLALAELAELEESVKRDS